MKPKINKTQMEARFDDGQPSQTVTEQEQSAETNKQQEQSNGKAPVKKQPDKTNQGKTQTCANTKPAAQTTKLVPWKTQLVKAQDKFLAITDERRAKTELGFCVQIFESNEELRKCTPESILNAVINIARTGITINPVLHLAYLIPRKGQCTLDISYRGLVKILKDYGCIKNIDAFIVYEDETFKHDPQSGTIVHEMKYAQTEAEQKKRQIKGAYTRAILPDNTVIFSQLMPIWEIQKTRKVSKGAGSEYSPWNTWFEEMVKKTVLKRSFKLLISGDMPQELHEVMKVEEDNTVDVQQKKHKTMSNLFGDSNEQVQDVEEVNEVQPKT